MSSEIGDESFVPHYAVVDTRNIKGFFGNYRFLSNFYEAPTAFDGLIYPTSEHAYQAAKFSEDERERFLGLTAGQAKKLGQKGNVNLEWWEENKRAVMKIIVVDKFYRNPDLRQLLLATGDRHLEETNSWGDKTWGVCSKLKIGENALGKILMQVREFWK